MKRTLQLLALAALLQGCAAFTSPLEHPVYEQHAQDRINTFSVIPSRRMVIMKSEDPSKPLEKKIIVCAEASADVTDNLTSTLAASLAASGPTSPGGQTAGDVAASISKMLQTTGQFLFKRTQGIQLYRDGMYHLCQARMNGFIPDQEYNARATGLLELVIPLIREEVTLRKPDDLAGNSPSGAADNSPMDRSSMPAVGARAGRSAASISADRVDTRIEPEDPAEVEAPEIEEGPLVPPPSHG